MKQLILKLSALFFFFFKTVLFSQNKVNNCPKELSYYAYSLPIEGVDWYVPVRYFIHNDLIDLYIRKNNKEELYIRFKIIEILECQSENINNSDLKYKILTYDEETNTYEEKQSEIDFKFSNGKGKIYIRHPNFPEIINDATALDITRK